jgi:hypothetical protein
MVVDLSRMRDELWRGISRARRGEIEDGLAGAVFHVYEPEYPGDYILFEETVGTKVAKFPVPLRWLEEGHLFAAYVRGKMVAAMLTHVRIGSLVLRRDVALRQYEEVHAALTWRVIMWAKEHGFKEFDQGGYNVEKNPGVSFWKASFGGVESERDTP